MKIVIGRDNCVWCDKATDLLDKQGVPYVYVSVHDRKSTRLNSSHGYISYAVFCLKKRKQTS